MPIRRALHRMSLQWQLLVPLALAVCLCVAADQAWTLRVVQASLEHETQLKLNASQELLTAYLQPLGSTWSRESGQLMLGANPVAGRNDIVDQAASATGGVATIFSGDERVATSVRKPDGSRAVGTHLMDATVREAVLVQGTVYHGVATILDHPYFTIYEPVRDEAGQIVGILFTGIPTAELEATTSSIISQASLAGVVVVGLFLLALVWLLAATLRPLSALASATRTIAGGGLSTDVPGTDRSDQIGAVAVSVQMFKQAALDKVRRDGEAAGQRDLVEVERRRGEKERGAVAEAQNLVVTSLANGLGHLADGDITFRLTQPFPPQYEGLRSDFNGAMEQLQGLISAIVASTVGLRASTTGISRAADDLSGRTHQQVLSLERTIAALNEMAATVRRTAEGAHQARDVAADTRAAAEDSNDVVRQAVTAMSEIEKSSRQIGQIIGVIDEIAFQTNLLALNAGVEAARAGESGRGFAVIASEVRALAQRSSDAAKAIKTLISASGQQVDRGVQLVDQTGEVLTSIAAQVSEVVSMVFEIATNAGQQASGLSQVNEAIDQMEQVTQQNAIMVKDSTAASHALAQDTEHLSRLAAQFKLDHRATAKAA